MLATGQLHVCFVSMSGLSIQAITCVLFLALHQPNMLLQLSGRQQICDGPCCRAVASSGHLWTPPCDEGCPDLRHPRFPGGESPACGQIHVTSAACACKQFAACEQIQEQVCCQHEAPCQLDASVAGIVHNAACAVDALGGAQHVSGP